MMSLAVPYRTNANVLAVSRGILLERLLPGYEASFASVAPGEYVTIMASSGRSISVSRGSARFPNGATMHIIAWHEVRLEDEDALPGRARARSHLDIDMLEAGTAPVHALLGGPRVVSEVEEPAEGAGGGGRDGARSERSGKTTATSIATVFRKAMLDGQEEAPLPLRRLRAMGLLVVCIIAAAAISLTSVAATNLNSVLASTQLVSSAANRCEAHRGSADFILFGLVWFGLV
jgi:hypothetical protein